VAAGATPKYVHFWGHTPRPGAEIGEWVLGQWWEQPFGVDGVRYPATGYWMMAGKARLFSDHEVLGQILAADHPAEVNKLGRKVRNFDGEHWIAHRVQIVTEGNVHKFGQHADLRDYLLSTAGRVLVEASPRDSDLGHRARARPRRRRAPRSVAWAESARLRVDGRCRRGGADQRHGVLPGAPASMGPRRCRRGGEGGFVRGADLILSGEADRMDRAVV
jgi:ribA/ribD-fused uncharacterized protein